MICQRLPIPFGLAGGFGIAICFVLFPTSKRPDVQYPIVLDDF